MMLSRKSGLSLANSARSAAALCSTCIRQHPSAYVSIRQHASANSARSAGCADLMPTLDERVCKTCIYIHTYIHACIHTHLHACIIHTDRHPSIHPYSWTCGGNLMSVCQTYAYVRTRQHTSAYVSIRQHTNLRRKLDERVPNSHQQHTSAYVRIRQHTNLGRKLDERVPNSHQQHTSAYVRIRQHTSAYEPGAETWWACAKQPSEAWRVETVTAHAPMYTHTHMTSWDGDSSCTYVHTHTHMTSWDGDSSCTNV